MEEDIYRAAVVRAAELVGGAEALSARLQVPMTELTRWLRGEAHPGLDTLIRIIEIIIDQK